MDGRVRRFDAIYNASRETGSTLTDRLVDKRAEWRDKKVTAINERARQEHLSARVK